MWDEIRVERKGKELAGSWVGVMADWMADKMVGEKVE